MQFPPYGSYEDNLKDRQDTELSWKNKAQNKLWQDNTALKTRFINLSKQRIGGSQELTRAYVQGDTSQCLNIVLSTGN